MSGAAAGDDRGDAQLADLEAVLVVLVVSVGVHPGCRRERPDLSRIEPEPS